MTAPSAGTACRRPQGIMLTGVEFVGVDRGGPLKLWEHARGALAADEVAGQSLGLRLW